MWGIARLRIKKRRGKFHDAWLLCLWLDDLFEKLVDVALADAGDDVVVDGDADTFGAMVETESAADGDLAFSTLAAPLTWQELPMQTCTFISSTLLCDCSSFAILQSRRGRRSTI